MIQEKSTYIPRSYWQSLLLSCCKALALCLKVFKVVDKSENKKTAQAFYLVVDDEGKLKCTSCERCMIVCPTQCLTVKGNKHLGHLDYLKIDMNSCINCYLCQDICPEEALYFGEKRQSEDKKVQEKS